MNVPKSALIFTIDQLKVKHHKEIEKMRKMKLVLSEIDYNFKVLVINFALYSRE